jgi:DNA-binding NarL/FixJ family response regulator
MVGDSHEVVRLGVRRLVESHDEWEFAGEASDGREVLELALRERPDVAVIDVSMPMMCGLTVTQRLRREAPGVNVLLFTIHEDDDTIRAGVEAGARGYLLKTDSTEHLEAAISALGARRPYFSPCISELLLDTASNGHGRAKSLTSREAEVAQLIAAGYGNKQIARLLNISIKTVESHRAAAMLKAGSRSAAEFVRFAIRQRLIQA